MRVEIQRKKQKTKQNNTSEETKASNRHNKVRRRRHKYSARRFNFVTMASLKDKADAASEAVRR